VEIALFELDGGGVAVETGFEGGFDRGEIFGMDEMEAVALAKLVEGVAGDLAVGGVGVDEISVGIANRESDSAAP